MSLTKVVISSYIILDDLRRIASIELDSRLHGPTNQGGELTLNRRSPVNATNEHKEPPPLELCTHTFRPVIVNGPLSRLSLLIPWRVGAGLSIVLLALALFFPWTARAGMGEFYAVVGHPAFVCMLYVVIPLV